MARTAKSILAIHDITTDTERPPTFSAIVPLRAGAANSLDYGGEGVARLQQAAYPDIQPLILPLGPKQAFERALGAVRSQGWVLVAADQREWRVEAYDRTFWYGFVNDIVIRVTPEGARSRIDVRSVSRVGRSDLGNNAKRIRRFIAEVGRGGP
ncbi:MAG: DUF1499 domain-containing protein [Deltaproteobacteria bacterium]|nr:DUF1499 domain-containing protein [Deltaproteobacteria bacterium]